jgi:predicted Rossmann-fold nucleotide-binding protein
MFVRRFLLAIKSNALVFFPGGFGTLNELSEYVDLMLIDITDKVPVILVGKEFWQGFFDWLLKQPGKHKLIKKSDLKYFTIVDSVDEAYKELCKHKKKK